MTIYMYQQTERPIQSKNLDYRTYRIRGNRIIKMFSAPYMVVNS